MTEMCEFCVDFVLAFRKIQIYVSLQNPAAALVLFYRLLFGYKTLDTEIALKNPLEEDIRTLQIKLDPIKENEKIIGGSVIFIDIT